MSDERDDEQPDNVIDFANAKKKVVSLAIESASTGYGMVARVCMHLRYTVHEKTRSVTCNDCGAVREAFDILVDVALRERSFGASSEVAKAARETLEKLHDEEKRVKSRLGAARKALYRVEHAIATHAPSPAAIPEILRALSEGRHDDAADIATRRK